MKQKRINVIIFYAMRITFLQIVLALIFTFSSYASRINAQAVLNKPVTVMAEQEVMKKILVQIQKQTGVKFTYSSDVIDVNMKISCILTNKKLVDFLDEVLKPLDIDYRVIDDQQILLFLVQNSAENIRKAFSAATNPIDVIISGTVTNEIGEPLQGASITEKGTKNITVTDAGGNFTLKVKDEKTVIIISYTGYNTKEVVVDKEGKMTIVLAAINKVLSDVVIVGYGKQKAVTVTGAISSIGTKELLQSPQANISNMLAARLTGLLAQQQSGLPGQDQTILRIRGTGTFGGGGADPLVLIDGIVNPNFNNLDPNEIETVTILKDASATAVYGVRGANGVLIITTKRGKEGKPRLSYTFNEAVTEYMKFRQNSNSYDWANGYNQAIQYDSYITGAPYVPLFSNADLQKYKSGSDPIFYPSTNWVDLMLKRSTSQSQHNLNISGGSKRIKYFVSAGLFNQGGLFKNTNLVPGYNNQINYRRYNFRTNFDFDITDRLSAQVNTAAQIESNRGPYSINGSNNIALGSITTILAAVVEAPPVLSPGVVDGKLISSVPGQSFYRGNPLANMLGNGVFLLNNTYLDGSVRLNYKLDFITKGLSAHGTISYRNINQVATGHGKNVVTYSIVRLPDNTINFIPNSTAAPYSYSETISGDRETYSEMGIDYARKFGDHNISALVLYNQSKQINPGLLFLVPHEYQGLVGRVTYNYKERYMGEFDLGYNGTENFAPGKRFGYFPAYSLGWIVSKEPFFPSSDFISFLKLRASYGEVGNDVVGGTRFLYRPSSYTYTNANYQFGTSGSSFNTYIGSLEGALGNPDLTWERSKKTDIGADLRLFKDKLKITADWFKEKRDNILASFQTIPVIFGATLPQVNLGRMRNGGIDGDISFSDKIGHLNYWVKATYTYAHNVIEYMNEVTRPFPYQQRTGQRSGQIFGLVAEGLFNSWNEVNDPKRPVYAFNNNKIQPGDIKYKDVNGDGKIDVNDQVPIGYSNFPEEIYGFSLGGDFKGFDFSLLFQGAAKVSFQYLQITQTPYNSGSASPNYWIYKSWTQDRYDNGDDIKLPHLSVSTNTQTSNYQPSTFWNVDGTYLRLKNAEIGYTLPTSFLRRVGISSSRIYLNGNNLLTWANLLDGLDPEQRIGNNSLYQYPLTKTFNFGLNINF